MKILTGLLHEGENDNYHQDSIIFLPLSLASYEPQFFMIVLKPDFSIYLLETN